jgi:hypothetical protein
VAVPITVRSVVGRAGAPGVRADRRVWFLTTGVGRMVVRRRRALGVLTVFAVWYLR